MKTKEEILEQHYPHFDIPSGWMFDGSVSDVFSAMDEYAKQMGVEFFKWNAKKSGDYIDYLRRVDKAEGASEKEKELSHFEGATIEMRYELFLQETESESLNK